MSGESNHGKDTTAAFGKTIGDASLDLRIERGMPLQDATDLLVSIREANGTEGRSGGRRSQARGPRPERGRV